MQLVHNGSLTGLPPASAGSCPKTLASRMADPSALACSSALLAWLHSVRAMPSSSCRLSTCRSRAAGQQVRMC